MEILDNKEILDRVETMIRGFETDIADSKFQQGFLAALTAVHHEIIGSQAKWVTDILALNDMQQVRLADQ